LGAVSGWTNAQAALRGGGSRAIPHDAYGRVNVSLIYLIRQETIEYTVYAGEKSRVSGLRTDFSERSMDINASVIGWRVRVQLEAFRVGEGDPKAATNEAPLVVPDSMRPEVFVWLRVLPNLLRFGGMAAFPRLSISVSEPFLSLGPGHIPR
jgi:hypothetical protein